MNLALPQEACPAAALCDAPSSPVREVPDTVSSGLLSKVAAGSGRWPVTRGSACPGDSGAEVSSREA
ncbi:hypothetical protein GCM10010339_94540 [Streptomyces alanosinicus]|uniref:Uncharacterized protein n=1 Tax=Streptomyces alanosinicus TaxID=68171 RepID=A0A918MIN5_9ACTN|nr:hypothetical protein GCM10010339_94540 [Streptomyces alanosinicus]